MFFYLPPGHDALLVDRIIFYAMVTEIYRRMYRVSVSLDARVSSSIDSQKVF